MQKWKEIVDNSIIWILTLLSGIGIMIILLLHMLWLMTCQIYYKLKGN